MSEMGELMGEIDQDYIKEFENLLNSQMSKVKIQEGKIPIVRIGSLIRIPLTEIQRMIDVSSNACQEGK